MKSRKAYLLCLAVSAALTLPAACGNDSGTDDSDARSDDDAAGGEGGMAGDGDGDTVGDGDGDGDGVIPGVTCELAGEACGAAGECCSGHCDAGTDTCSCAPAGLGCLAGDDCCSGQCNPETMMCVTVLGTCAQAETPCGSGSECCSLSCIDGLCSDNACTQDTQACSIDDECCSGSCVDNTCAKINAGSGQSCNTAGNACDDGVDCCSGLCNEDDGVCLIGASYCVQTYDVCRSDTECCQGVCVREDGAAAGYCGVQQTGGTNCGNKKIAGQVCGGGAAAENTGCDECCSRTCATYGPSGVSICQPATGCRPDGELCRTSNDCCGGDPDSSIPGAGQAECLKVSPDDEVGRCKVGACNPHGAICGSPDAGTAACSGSLSSPNGRSCCEKNLVPKGENACSVDSLRIPRCDVLQGCVDTGGDCATADDCCNGNPCVQNAEGRFSCFDTPGSCSPAGGPCTASADCCVGSLCLLEPGQSTGVCGNSGPPGTGGSGAGGNSGTGGTPEVCASFGQDCSVEECCAGIPCDPATNTCRFPAGG